MLLNVNQKIINSVLCPIYCHFPFFFWRGMIHICLILSLAILRPTMTVVQGSTKVQFAPIMR